MLIYSGQIVEEAKNSGVEYPQKMLNKCEEKHKCMIEKMVDAKIYMSMYK